jgi:cytochrome P450
MSTTAEVQPDAVLLELLMTQEGKADPYPRYAALHAAAPAFRSGLGSVVLSRFDDCQFVLRDPRFGKATDAAQMAARFNFSEDDLDKVRELTTRSGSMLTMNPPDHTRLRALVSKAFTPKAIEALRPHIERLTDGFLDDMGGEVDVMTALAFPLPVTVIGELLGIPPGDRAQFQGLVRTVTKTMDMGISTEALQAGIEASDAMVAYFADLIAERRKAPGDDMLTELIAAEDEGDQLTEDELISTMILLFAAGFETTTNLIGNGLFALLRSPDQLRRLRHDPSLLRPGVEELLRYDSPVQVNGRNAFEDVEVAGQQVVAGEMVMTLLGAANHDPTHFTDPDRLDVGRNQGPPLSFGSGIHYCLGAALARVEGQVVFGRLLERFGSIELCGDEPCYRDSLTLRGLETLPVAVHV